MNNYYDFIPEEVIQEIREYEEKIDRKSKGRSKTRFPSNEDVVDAIMKITGGVLTKHNVETLYDNVIEYLKNQGFNTSALTESRVERLVNSLIRRGVLSKRI